jgi:aryl-alcohol dehydrogenase-like predicted oxidoreductase
MRYVEAGGEKISVIGLGCWQFGSWDWGYGDEYAQSTAIEITNRALDLGVNLVDTAEIYGFGHSEKIVGRAIADRRDDVFLATKILPLLPIAPIVEQRAKSSIMRMRVDKIDLYQIHWPNPLVGDGTAMTGMRRLIDSGLVRHAGVSNYPLSRWMSADRALGLPVLTNQVRMSLVDRRPLIDLVPFARSEGRVVIAYSPLAQGLLGGRYDADNLPTGTARRSNPLFLPENLERAEPLIGALRDVAATHQCTPAQIALAWVIRNPNVVAIPGASSIEQVEANVAAAEIELSDSEAAQLDGAADAFEPIRGAAALREMAENVVSGLRERLGHRQQGTLQ